MVAQTSESDAIKSLDEAEAAMAIVTAQQIQITEQLTLKNKLAVQVQELQKKIDELVRLQGRHRYRLNVWADSVRTEWGEKKSLELRQGTIGFREGRRAVKLLENWTEKTVLAKLRKLGKKFRCYIRVKEEIDRQLILSDSRPEVARLKEKQIQKFGLEVRRDETFFCEPRLDQA